MATARVVKIDVEGAEPAVLAGLLPVLDDMPADVELVVEVTPDAGDCADDPVRLLRQRGFHTYRLDNDYRLVSYLRTGQAPPRRFRGPVTERTDVVFSRTDSSWLP